MLGERRWTQARLARETGIRPSTISAYYNELAERISYEHMDRICEALDCDVSDLLERVPSRQRKTGKDLILEQHGNRKLNNKRGNEKGVLEVFKTLLKRLFCFSNLSGNPAISFSF